MPFWIHWLIQKKEFELFSLSLPDIYYRRHYFNIIALHSDLLTFSPLKISPQGRASVPSLCRKTCSGQADWSVFQGLFITDFVPSMSHFFFYLTSSHA